MEDYKRDVGRRLRAVRHMQGLTLADVEERSDGEWKAVVVGSYERGDRGISVPRLSSLAAFYGVPVSHLLPAEDRSDNGRDGATIDLAVLAEVAAECELDTLARFVERIKQARGDYNGRVLTLRGDDIRTVAAATGHDAEEFVQRLRDAGLVVDASVVDSITSAPRPATAL